MKEEQSGLSIASFTISLIEGIVLFMLIVIAGILENTTSGGMDEESTEAILIGIGMISLIFVSFFSLALGIAGLIQKNTKNVFGILGTVFSAGIFLFLVILISIAE